MEREPVTGSSNIKSVGYDEDARLLEVEFKGGKVYRYANVPPEVHEAWKTAGFRGAYFHKRIRSLYEGVRVQTKGVKG